MITANNRLLTVLAICPRSQSSFSLLGIIVASPSVERAAVDNTPGLELIKCNQWEIAYFVRALHDR